VETALASGSAKAKDQLDTLMIVNTGKSAFPVAWRPAFISRTHFEYVLKLMDRGWFRYLLSKVGIEESDAQILFTLRRDVKFDRKEVPHPKELSVQVSQGPAIPFDEKNEEHLRYLRGVNVLYGCAP
jgi:hypothetical protein